MKSMWSNETGRRIKQLDKIRCCVLLTCCSLNFFFNCYAFVSRTSGSGYDSVTSLHSCFKLDTRYRPISDHAWLRGVPAGETRLLRLLAARVFHTIVTFQKKSGPGTISTGWIPNKLDSGFQWLDSGFHELDSGFQSRGFRIPQVKIARIPDSGLPHMGRCRGYLLSKF